MSAYIAPLLWVHGTVRSCVERVVPAVAPVPFKAAVPATYGEHGQIVDGDAVVADMGGDDIRSERDEGLGEVVLSVHFFCLSMGSGWPPPCLATFWDMSVSAQIQDGTVDDSLVW